MTSRVLRIALGTPLAFGLIGAVLPTPPAAAASPSPAVVSPVVRYAGPSRFDTAAAISRGTFANIGDVKAVYIANAYNFPDALAGAAAAGLDHGPVLLAAASGTLAAATKTELARLQPTKIVVLGGRGAVGDDVVTQLRTYTTNIVRLSGPTRFSTASNISQLTFHNRADAQVVYIANASNFPDALAGAAAAGTVHGPILLVAASGPLDPSVRVELMRLAPKKIVVLGGTGVVSDEVVGRLKGFCPTVVRYYGSNRFATGADVSSHTFTPTNVKAAYIAYASNFPDALAGAAAAGLVQGPVLLSATHLPLDPSVVAELTRLHPAQIFVLGDEGVIGSDVFDALAAYAG